MWQHYLTQLFAIGSEHVRTLRHFIKVFSIFVFLRCLSNLVSGIRPVFKKYLLPSGREREREVG